MTLMAISAVLLACVVGLVTFFLTRKGAAGEIEAVRDELSATQLALSNAKIDFEARQQELRRSIDEARTRESEAKAKADDADKRSLQISDELKAALEEKGRLHAEAARLEETKSLVADRDGQIEILQNQVKVLEREKAEAVKDAEAADRRADDLIAKEREAQGEIVKAKDDQIARLNEFIAQAREVLTTEFKAVSADTLRDATAQLVHTTDVIIEKHDQKAVGDVALHHEQIGNMLKPVEETIKRLDKHVEDTNLARTAAEALLDDQVKRLAGASESLTNALRKPVVRGSWGEMTLENALENAGLEPEIDFILQHSTDAEDGGRQRTDAVINLPKGRKLIIDSKNLMESYIALANAQDEAQRAVLAEAHSKSLRSHIKALSAKEYWKRYDGLDCVILFIPHDGMYHTAIQDEADVIREACEKRVFIANPMTLIPLLKAIRYVLDQERLNKSAEDISKVGTELYEEIARFANHMGTIGDRLKSTVKAYNDSIPGLDRFIVAKSRKLKQLGSAKGPEAELPDAVDLEPRPFASPELSPLNLPAADDYDEEAVEAALTT